MELLIDAMLEVLNDQKKHKPTEGRSVKIEEQDLEKLAVAAMNTFSAQPVMLEVDAPMLVAGDIHGQFYDLLRIFEYGGSPENLNYLFLGDYVDRGQNSIECVAMLFCYKTKHPENFFLLRGNHECSTINKLYGFFDECKRRYSIKLWKTFGDAFNQMPVCAVMADRIICMHGGLSPMIMDSNGLDLIREIKRPLEVPDGGLLCDLLWSDPVAVAAAEGWHDNDRGVSFTFGENVVTAFLKKHDLDLVCRAHQVVEDGYEFFCGRKLVTVFSAPNYCREFDNCGAIMIIDDDLSCSFKVLKPIMGKGVVVKQLPRAEVAP